MPRVDQGDWRRVHFDAYTRTDGYQMVYAQLTQPFTLVQVSVIAIEVRTTWLRAGWTYQRWGNQYTGTIVSRHFLPLQDTVLLKLEPVASSWLQFRIVPWIFDFGIQIDADYSSIVSG